MPSERKDQLGELLKQRAKDAEAQAIESGGTIAPEEYEALRRLARIAEIRSKAEPARKRISRITIAVFGLTLVIVSILFFARVSMTEIELDVALSQLGFRLPQQQVLTDATRLSSLGVSGLTELQLPHAESRKAQTMSAPDASGTAVRLSSADGQRKGELTLDALNVPAATQVWLRPTEVPQQWRLSLHGPDLTLQAAADGSILVGVAGARSEKFEFASPQPVVMRGGQNDIDLDLEFPAGLKTYSFSPQDVAESLSFTRVDEHSDAEYTLVRRISTVLSGSLFFEALAGRELHLRAGEGLRFQWSHGEIRTLELRDGHIALTFHGEVRGMTTGAGENRRSLMPTYLEWLSSQHGLSLLWGTALYLFGLVIGVLRNWGIE
jgi:hypothetical protein